MAPATHPDIHTQPKGSGGVGGVGEGGIAERNGGGEKGVVMWQCIACYVLLAAAG